MAYKGSVTRIERFSSFVLFLVMLVLAGFLSALGNKVLEDVDQWVASPEMETFMDKAAMAEAEKAQAALRQQTNRIEDTQAAYGKSLERAERQYRAEKQSYADWLQARTAIGSSQEDAAVRERAQALDRVRRIQESWQAKIDETEAANAPLEKQVRAAEEKVQSLREAGERKFEQARRAYELKIFFLRLGLVLPVLALGVLVFARFRKNRFWPLSWGFILFSAYAFFVGLLPYLPSFGGYIRLVVGVALTLFIGFYVIKQLTRYLQTKRAELAASAQDRVRQIKDETAVRAFQSHSCPSCERDFLIKTWYPKTRQATEIRNLDEAPDHCAYCGLPLFGKCPACGNRNFLHFPFCSACGRPLETLKSKPGA
jgi:hypothetical protein